MAKKNRNNLPKGQSYMGILRYVFKKDSLLGVVVISLLGWYLHGLGVSEQTKQEVTVSVALKCTSVRDNLIQLSRKCLQNEKVTTFEKAKRYKLRDELVKSANAHKYQIPKEYYFSYIKLTRFGFSEGSQNLCKFSKKELQKLVTKLSLYCIDDRS